MAHRLVWGRDLYKGFKLKNNDITGTAIYDIVPFQMLSLEDKTEDWVKAVADFYDIAGWRNVERKAGKIQRNYMMRAGKLNPSDYIINPELNPLSDAIGMILPKESQSPLEQFYPIAPNFVDVLRGEFLKRDNRWVIDVQDPFSKNEMFEEKKSQFEAALMQMAQLEKMQTLASMGLTEEVDPEQYQAEMQKTMQQLTEIEFKSRNFRTTGAQWADKVLKIHEKRYNLHELEPDGFESGLITDSEFWHLDLLEDDFKVELLNPKFCDYHKGPNIKYVSDGDYFLWFDFMSPGDIVNKFGRRMEEKDILKLREVHVGSTAQLIVPDQMKNLQGSYYDRTKPWAEATDLNPAMNDSLLGHTLAYNYMRTPNFDHNIQPDIFGGNSGREITGHPQMFRVMRLYWRSLRRVGWLTKIERDGTTVPPDWVDENFKVTVEPVYDNSITKEKTKNNLLYGEHIDWTWAPEWRHVIKVAANGKHSFWLDKKNNYDSIYIDGGPVKFQFRGMSNPFDSLPPVEGCVFSHINTEPHGFIDRVRSMQILYNICMNQVPKKFLEDKGMKIAIDKRSYSTNNTDAADGMDPREAYEAKLDESQILEYSMSREALEGLGQPALPSILNLSTVQEAQLYFSLGQQIKMEAGELIGISRNRLGQNKASDTATGIQQGIVYSETQTEKYYEQHSNLMQRFRQRMLDAAQYYSTFYPAAQDVYQNDREENMFLAIEGAQNLTRHYNIFLQSRANVRAALQTISAFLQNENTLPIKPSAKLEAIVEQSIPKIMSMVKKSELEQEAVEREKYQQEMQMRQQEIEAENQRFAEEQAREDERARLNRESQERIAAIRAMGGIQTDANADGTLDAKTNLDGVLRQQEITNSRRTAQDQLNQKAQSDLQKNLTEREKAQLEVQKEIIKQEGALKVAKENKTAAEMKRKSKN